MNALICPLCLLGLVENPQGVACTNRHQFDRAKEGYFNLLPVHYKNSREPGDAKEQLIARRKFLGAGYFLPLMAELKRIIPLEITNLLDIGCGEGYFTHLFHEHCCNAQIYGVDISKPGVRLAAKGRSNGEHYLVASSHSLPIADNSMDLITRIYAPSKDEELLRALKPTGRLIIVTPGERHLLELRKRIYDVITPHPKPLAPKGFVELEQSSVCFSLDVPPGELTQALLQMTPFSWKLNPALAESIVQQGHKDYAEFQVNVYRRSDELPRSPDLLGSQSP
ncbi:MAG: methyltransferase domain-containing protein [Gammaproteobacteria bacterium]|nr:MAG: methyltransferase domain-containing protein [Gammaproteobacteria bacterium]